MMKKALLLLIICSSFSLFTMQSSLRVKEKQVKTIVQKSLDPARKCYVEAKKLTTGKLDPLECKSSISFSSKLELDTGQQVFILGEDHSLKKNRTKGNHKNLQILKTLLALADDFKTEEPAIHFEIEHHMPVDNEKVVKQGEIPQTVLHGLYLLALKKNYKRSTVANAEVRNAFCVTKIIMEIEPANVQYTFFKDTKFIHEAIKEYHNCDVLTITWRDLIKDFDRLNEICQGYRDSWPNNNIKKEFDRMLRNAERSFKQPKELIRLQETDDDSWKKDDPNYLTTDGSIFTYYENYNSKELQENMQPFLKMLTSAFCPFVDMHIFHKILILRKENKVPCIIIYAGELHSREVSAALQLAEIIAGKPQFITDDQFTIKAFGWLFNHLETNSLDSLEETCYSSTNKMENKQSKYFIHLIVSVTVLLVGSRLFKSSNATPNTKNNIDKVIEKLPNYNDRRSHES